MNNLDEYQQCLFEEVMQFTFLCGDDDAKKIFKKYKKSNLEDFVRLACIAITLGYRRLFLKILQEVERDMDEFMLWLDRINHDFGILDGWMNEFIENIKTPEAREFIEGVWTDKKKKVDPANFNMNQIM